MWIPVERLIIQYNQLFGRQHYIFEGMCISVALILSYYFVGILSFYAMINSDDVSLFADSSFTFLAMLNYVIYQFE